MNRFSSCRQKLSQSFLAERIRNAKAYDRIAGYFCGSDLETAGEAIDSVTGPIRVVCNSGLRPEDVNTTRAAAALRHQPHVPVPARHTRPAWPTRQRTFTTYQWIE